MRHRILAALGVATAVIASIVAAAPAQAAPAAATQAAPDLGPNVLVFDPSMPASEIQSRIDAVTTRQIDAEMGPGRYALLFKPGTYGTAAQPLRFQVGYYTEVAGLGRNPGDVVINGAVEVYNRCLPVEPGAPDNCIALVNFWRSLSNLTINTAGGEGCRANTNFWAVSQAAPMRRVVVNGGTLSLMDYCTAGPQYASGGFIADSAITTAGPVVNGSQQQFLVRNSALPGWSNAVWNQVFAGTSGAPAQSFPDPPYTTLATTPVSKERPYLFVDERGAWNVFVPSARRDTAGTTWQGGSTPGRSIPLRDFYVAKPGDSIAKINLALLLGKNLLLTPGVYDVASTILVSRPNTVVLGLGLPTLTAQRGAVVMQTLDIPGIDLAGFMVDGGAVNSPVLMRIGTRLFGGGSAGNPVALQDIFFRLGGPHVGKATVSLEVNSDHAILDNLWVWRADHGQGVGWTVNTGATGLIVNGDDVTATGLFVEHYQRYQTIWRGERGRTILYQNEMPYDPPTQADWSHDGVNGYAAYKVADSVRTHEAWGLGSYIYTNVNPSLHATNAFEVPQRPGVRMHDLLTVSLNKSGTIDHVINGVGEAVTPDRLGPEYVVSYP